MKMLTDIVKQHPKKTTAISTATVLGAIWFLGNLEPAMSSASDLLGHIRQTKTNTIKLAQVSGEWQEWKDIQKGYYQAQQDFFREQQQQQPQQAPRIETWVDGYDQVWCCSWDHQDCNYDSEWYICGERR